MFNRLLAVHAADADKAVARAEQHRIPQAGGDLSPPRLSLLGDVAEEKLAAREAVPVWTARGLSTTANWTE